MSQADRCPARVLWDPGDLKTSRRGSRVHRSTRTNPVGQAGCSSWGNGRHIRCRASPPGGVSSDRQAPGRPQAAGGSRRTGVREPRAGTQSRGPQGQWAARLCVCPLAARMPPVLQTASRLSFRKARPTASPTCLLNALQKARLNMTPSQRHRRPASCALLPDPEFSEFNPRALPPLLSPSSAVARRPCNIYTCLCLKSSSVCSVSFLSTGASFFLFARPGVPITQMPG